MHSMAAMYASDRIALPKSCERRQQTMTRKRRNTRFTFTKTISETPMSGHDLETAEDLLARMVARAIAVDQGWLKVEVEK